MFTKIERAGLSYFATAGLDKSMPRPKGLSGVGLTNFIKRGWIERFGRDGPTGEQLYRIKPAGLEAYLASSDPV